MKKSRKLVKKESNFVVPGLYKAGDTSKKRQNPEGYGGICRTIFVESASAELYAYGRQRRPIIGTYFFIEGE